MEEYRKIDIEVLKDFIEGEEHDVYLLIKKLCFKDMYMSLYEYSFKDLNDKDPLDKFVITAFNAYKIQNKLNKCLKVRDGKYYDDYLIGCVVGEIYQRFNKANALKNISKENFKNLIIEKEKNHLDNFLINEYNVDFLISLITNKFGKNNTVSVNEITDYIYEISNKEKQIKTKETLQTYINELIKESNFTLNQLGNESLIKKNIYELLTDKLPTKNNLIMLSFALRLTKEKRENLFGLAKKEIENKSNSNMYNFDIANNRDKLILYWLNNIDELDNISKRKNKYIVEVFNDILASASYDILK